MGVTAGLAAAAVIGGVAAAAMAPKPPKAPDAPPPPALAPARQADKLPDSTTFMKQNQDIAGPGGALAGNSSTFLTGAGGVDSSLLTLGKSTLLGS